MFDSFARGTLVPLILRVGLAVIFIYHGLDKVSESNEWGARWAGSSSDALPVAAQVAVAWGELLGGIAIGLGFLTRLAALGIAAIMAGAIYTVHAEHGFSMMNHGYEYNFALLVMCAALIFSGAGKLSLDRLLFDRHPPRSDGGA